MAKLLKILASTIKIALATSFVGAFGVLTVGLCIVMWPV